MHIAIHTLGCKVNQCDADALITALKTRGFNAFSTREFDVCADVFIINTCTVTHTSDKKSRQMIRRAKKKNPTALVAMCGCMAKKSSEIDGVDFVFDAREPSDFLAKIDSLNVDSARVAQELPKSKTRSFIKIQDGCDRFCSYCIVPYVRGELKSRPLSEIIAEAETRIKTGALEIVLTGIQVAAYGNDTTSGFLKEGLAHVVRKISALDGLKRLRLSSIDPCAVDEDFLDAVAASPVLCEHFHLSLQSGCDTTLKKMNRRYTAARYKNAADALRKIRPTAVLTTDIIVGFPGETDSDFTQSLDFVREMEFSQVHVFEFSPREGTPAATFPAQIPQNIKHERGKIMRETVSQLQKNFLCKQVGKELHVLFEKEKQHGMFEGNSQNYCTVHAPSAFDIRNTIQKVKIISCTENLLKGEIST
ncbi:MAG: tRNA (N(6)-L-threonylcarbamoyladenosine(37)-C(2))-methylthiotransferase MtaB [Defluviitaleaceae bacterium]|nr:tRNA (N(6)-L-threonylcarbamoyladenosine(37)-C(2))-methylthiotransferase MtaB [Defluviitaleaceae bacterium]MCL2261843.1 tRNA (N(6)-L-threonylcarbamoyladenosine(37)-C(2))-methylthiotransferase MtaB [Defluviitaleaceae bacterium]